MSPAVAELARQPDVMAVELLRRARLAGYAGGKSVLDELVAAIRPREQAALLVRFEGLPGEFSRSTTSARSRSPSATGRPDGCTSSPRG